MSISFSTPFDHYLPLFPVNLETSNHFETSTFPDLITVEKVQYASDFSYFSFSPILSNHFPTQDSVPTFDSSDSESLSSSSSDSDSPISNFSDSDISESNSVGSDSPISKDDESSSLKLKKAKKENNPSKMLATTKNAKGFELEIVKINETIEIQMDSTKLAKDFRPKKFSYKDIGYEHVWKRLNFFLTMTHYLASKSPYLENEYIPMILEKDQFKTRTYFVPESYSTYPQEPKGLYEKAHISLLNKIVFKQEEDGPLLQMKGKLTVKKENTTLTQFFNLCDLVPKVVNSIDGYAEFYLRERAIELLSGVKDQENPYPYCEAAKTLANDYRDCLMGLKKRISKKDYRTIEKLCSRNLKQSFLTNTSSILKHPSALSCIDGMLKAVDHFTDHYNLKAKYPSKPALYVKI